MSKLYQERKHQNFATLYCHYKIFSGELFFKVEFKTFVFFDNFSVLQEMQWRNIEVATTKGTTSFATVGNTCTLFLVLCDVLSNCKRKHYFLHHLSGVIKSTSLTFSKKNSQILFEQSNFHNICLGHIFRGIGSLDFDVHLVIRYTKIYNNVDRKWSSKMLRTNTLWDSCIPKTFSIKVAMV